MTIRDSKRGMAMETMVAPAGSQRSTANAFGWIPIHSGRRARYLFYIFFLLGGFAFAALAVSHYFLRFLDVSVGPFLSFSALAIALLFMVASVAALYASSQLRSRLTEGLPRKFEILVEAALRSSSPATSMALGRYLTSRALAGLMTGAVVCWVWVAVLWVAVAR